MPWAELAIAGVQAIAAGFQVFADKAKSIAERLEKDPKVAGSPDRIARLEEIAGRD